MTYGEILEEIIKKNGKSNQCNIAKEECAELIQAISKMEREPSKENLEHLIEEMGDVSVVLDELKMMFNISEFSISIVQNDKAHRTAERMGIDYHAIKTY